MDSDSSSEWDFNKYTQMSGFLKDSPTVYISPVSPVKSPIFDKSLITHDNNLSKREEEFLIELKEFYEGVAHYEELMGQMEKNKQRLAGKSLNLLQLASNLSAYQQILEERANEAQQILSEPLDDLSHEQQLIDQLEKEVKEYKQKLPKTSSGDKEADISSKLEQAQRIAAENTVKENELKKKQVLLDARQKELEAELESLDKLEQEEDEKMGESKETAQRLLEETPAIDIEAVEKQRAKRDELVKRREDLKQKKAQMEQDTAKSESAKKQQEEDLTALQKELQELTESKKKVEDAHITLDGIASQKAQLDIDNGELDDEIARLKRKLEVQNNELARMQTKQNDINRRKNEIDEKARALEEKKKDIEKRREILAKNEEECDTIKAQLAELKKSNIQKDLEVSKLEKQVKDMLEKVIKAQDEIDAKAAEHQELGNSERLNELQRLLSGSPETQ